MLIFIADNLILPLNPNKLSVMPIAHWMLRVNCAAWPQPAARHTCGTVQAIWHCHMPRRRDGAAA